MRTPVALLFAAALLPAGCADDDATTWNGPPPAQPGQAEVSVEEFNDYAAAADEAWGRLAVATAVSFALADGESASTVLTSRPQGEGAATVRITLSGLEDDSVEAVRWEIRLRRGGDERWRLTSARRAYRCHRGRGQRSFSAEFCL